MQKCPGVNDRRKSVIDGKKPPIRRESAGKTTDHSNYCTV